MSMFRNVIRKINGHQTNHNPTKAASSIDDTIIDVIQKLISDKILTVFDVGAHHGRYSRSIIQKLPEAKLYCFEPFPDSFLKLKENLKHDSINFFPIAISDFIGVSSFYVNVLDETNSLLPSVSTDSYVDELTLNKKIMEVPVTTINEISKQENISTVDLLKIDVQGSTLNVLKGATNLLKPKKIKIIQCEVEFLEIYKDQKLFHHITAFLENFGYSLYSLYNLHYDVNERLSWADAIFYIK